jgi:MoaA/NifB/PqqE/SkfB family radical SAM enzyme
MDKLNSSIINAYNETRAVNARGLLCHAPWVSINFEQNGNMTACCYNRKHVLGSYPKTSIKEAWEGEKLNELREYIKANDLSGGCSACGDVLNSGNFNGSKAKYYDEYATVQQRNGLFGFFKKSKQLFTPRVFEFEIANTCNLECIMCNGYFSSSIRKNREKLPPQYNPYDDNFVDQVAEFLPGITDLKYLGGEPFQIEIYLKIWEQVARINPAIRNHITTNGTILNARVKGLIENMRSGIILSIDSVRKDTYEKIRKGADFDKVMANLEYFLEYADRKGTYVSMTVCPITTNAEEIPEMVRFANQRNMRIHFNTVLSPDYLSLRFADLTRLNTLIGSYNATEKTSNELEASNYQKMREYASQLKFWYDERQTSGIDTGSSFGLLQNAVRIPENAGPLTRKILEQIMTHYTDQTFDAAYHRSLSELLSGCNLQEFIDSYFTAIGILEANLSENTAEIDSKIEAVKRTVKDLSQKELMATELVRTGVLYQLNYFRNESAEQITGSIISRYS